jgi:hypothetical protein
MNSKDTLFSFAARNLVVSQKAENPFLLNKMCIFKSLISQHCELVEKAKLLISVALSPHRRYFARKNSASLA